MINSIPNELLILILKLAITTSSSWRSYELSNSVISVCHHWEEIASHIPEYWTHLLIVLDAPTTRLSALSSHLEFSRGLPIEIEVTTGSQTTDRELEKSRARVVMTNLTPHMHRCKKIEFNLNHCSALPSLLRDFHGPAPLLTELALTGKSDDVVTSCPDEICWDFESPMLTKLAIKGANVDAVCNQGLLWLTKLKNLRTVEFSNYTASPKCPKQLSMGQVLLAIGSIPQRALRVIHVRFLELDCSDEADIVEVNLSPSIAIVEKLQPEFLFAFLHSMTGMLSQIEIINCPIYDLQPFAEALFLRKIPVGERFDLLERWHGRHLSVDDCPSFDDKALDSLTHFNCVSVLQHELCSLTLHGCPSVSFEGLKQFVKKTCLADIHITGGPVLENTEVEWLTKNLESFFWK
ncbi:hypothetical protein BJ138DRAFT_1155432 [Hygrophoropsis aurantiaca]|uniref:Uncharacterized protein n=1 Tax=Hygrophoropsis aurantiaca TaxID=72124 RepID=A0ACB8A9J2_9AGAM|nr:hypothetical protein BJ138DRAFT_1155432 [Hygrophoropsis aurantiaca]